MYFYYLLIPHQQAPTFPGNWRNNIRSMRIRVQWKGYKSISIPKMHTIKRKSKRERECSLNLPHRTKPNMFVNIHFDYIILSLWWPRTIARCLRLQHSFSPNIITLLQWKGFACLLLLKHLLKVWGKLHTRPCQPPPCCIWNSHLTKPISLIWHQSLSDRCIMPEPYTSIHLEDQRGKKYVLETKCIHFIYQNSLFSKD